MNTSNGRRPVAAALVISAIAVAFTMPATTVAATFQAPAVMAAAAPNPDADEPGTCVAASDSIGSSPADSSAERTPPPNMLRASFYPH